MPAGGTLVAVMPVAVTPPGGTPAGGAGQYRPGQAQGMNHQQLRTAR